MAMRCTAVFLALVGLVGCRSIDDTRKPPSPHLRVTEPWELYPAAALSAQDAATLVTRFSDPDPEVRADAAWSITAAHPSAIEVEALTHLLQDPDARVRDQASLAMYRLRHPWLVPPPRPPVPMIIVGEPTPTPTPIPAPEPALASPRILKQPRPTYPANAAIHRVQGTVVVELLISASGRVVRARVVDSIPGLDAAALDNVRLWEFAPAQRDGRPVPSFAYGEVTFRFK